MWLLQIVAVFGAVLLSYVIIVIVGLDERRIK